MTVLFANVATMADFELRMHRQITNISHPRVVAEVEYGTETCSLFYSDQFLLYRYNQCTLRPTFLSLKKTNKDVETDLYNSLMIINLLFNRFKRKYLVCCRSVVL